MRGYLLDSKLHKPKGASSKSPGQNKGAFEFASNGLKSDESSQNSPIKESANNQKKEKEKMRAFHREIEKRYNASESNQNYIFPRKQSQSFSLNSSLESLKDAITYNLHSVSNMVKAKKEEKRRGSTENSLGVSLTSSRRPSTRQIQTAREAFNESIRFSNKKARKRELGSQTSRGQTLEKRMLNSSEKTQPKKEKRKRLKLSISQSRKALLQGNNSTKQTDSVENTTALQTKVKKHSSKRSHAELLAKTISLNVNENNNNMNFGPEIKTAKNAKRQLDIKTNNLMSSFFPKMLSSTKSSKDLHCYSSKYPSHITNFFKAPAKAEGSSNKGTFNAMLSTMSSLPDKSLTSLKSSYSVFQNDPEKMNKSKTKLMNLRNALETSENQSSLLSFNPIPAEIPSTSRGASKSRGGKTKTNSLYQKTREDLMNRLRSSSGNKNHKSPALSPLRDLVKAPLTTRARENSDEMMAFIKKKIQSPRFEMSLLKAMGGGHTPLQKSLSIVKSAKDLHKIDKEKEKKPAPLNSKVVVHKSIKLKETKERSKGGDSKKPHLHIDLQKSCQFDKPKMKLNLQGLTQRVAPLSERGALTDDRSLMNKQHYSQTTDYLK